VLPNANYSPAESSQLRKIPAVTFSVLLDFCSPKLGEPPLPSRKSVTMPEITIDKNNQALSHKDNVRRSRQ
jgi:hypothetical protein